MPRIRSPERGRALEIFKEHNGDITNRKIADMLDVPEKTVGGWKSKDDWCAELNGALQTNKRSTPNKKTKQNKGNPSPVKKFTKRNQAATKSGLWSKYIHEDQLEIMQSLRDTDPADQLWLMIEIKFSAIIRAQQIMYVSSADDHLDEISGSGELTSYKVTYAHERYEAYLTAQSRAMAEYRNLIKQFVAITDEADERRIKLETMQVDLDIKRKKLNGDQGNGAESKLDKYMTMLKDALEDA